MKNFVFLLAVFVLMIPLVSCGGGEAVSTSNETTESTEPVESTESPITTDAPVLETPSTTNTLVYSYAMSDIGANAVQLEQIEGDLIYFNPYVPSMNHNLSASIGSSGTPNITSFNFFGEERTVQPFISVSAFPKHPKEYGTLSQFITPSEKGKSAASIYVRQNTGKVVTISGKFKEVFQNIDLNNQAEVVPYFTHLLSQYASFEGYTRFVYDTVIPSQRKDAICVEYNKTINGEKTNCLVKMSVAYDSLWCEVILQDDMEEVFVPYQNIAVDRERIDAIVREEIDKACATNSYRYNGYEAKVTLMVLDGKLKAYVEAVADMTTLDTNEDVYVPTIHMLITVASFE